MVEQIKEKKTINYKINIQKQKGRKTKRKLKNVPWKKNTMYAFGLASVSPRLAFYIFFFFGSVFSVFLTLCHTSGSVHCSRDLQTSFFSNFFIKNWFHGTIHTFKNYFITIFSVFSKISDIQTDFTLSMPFLFKVSNHF